MSPIGKSTPDSPGARAVDEDPAAPTPQAPSHSGRGRGLDLEDDPEFEQRGWRIQRAGWVAMLLLALAGLAGLFGSGPLSQAVTGVEPAGVRVEYPRFGRASAMEMIRVRVPPGPAAPELFALVVSREFLDRVQMEAITPAPAMVEARGQDLVYRFAGSPSAPEVWVALLFRPHGMGVLRARLGTPGGPPRDISLLVYP